MFRKIGGKLESANARAAEARKAWRDEKLSAREAKANERERENFAREEEVRSQFVEIKRLESRRGRRKFFFILTFCLGAFMGFISGFAMGLASPNSSPSPSEVDVSTMPIAGDNEIEEVSDLSAEFTSEDGDAAPITLSQCVDRGVEYFKEIGSYPTLSSHPDAGRPAKDVALERCGRTLTAFGPW
tara:strand:- start:621 stop:1178 length:558 start_codon:yes stop_codon:yes gene_type:complete